MADDENPHVTKHRRHHHVKDKGSERDSKKRHRQDRDEDTHSHKSKRPREKGKTSTKSKSKMTIIDDDPDEDLWVEKNIDMDGENPLATDIPTAESLKLTSHASATSNDPPLIPTLSTESKLVRDEWMLLPPSSVSVPKEVASSSASSSKFQIPIGNESFTEDYGEPMQGVRSMAGGEDFFSRLGTERARKLKDIKPDPEKPRVSSKELNRNYLQGISLETYPHSAPKAATPGGPGSNWRMMKLRRVYETANEEGKPVEEVALERYGSLEAFEEAEEERRILDEREGKRSAKGQANGQKGNRSRDDIDGERGRERRWMFNDVSGSGASSRSSSFRRPGGENLSAPSTPSPAPLADRRIDALRAPPKGSPLSMSHTPIPTVMTPPSRAAASGKKRLSTEELNKLQARVLRAKLMDDPNAAQLEREYNEEQLRVAGESVNYLAAEEEGDRRSRTRTQVVVLPTLDARGRLYDVGSGQADATPLEGNRRNKADKFETRDAKTGDLVRYNADDDTMTLGEMLRQEKFGAGAADQKNLDVELADAITKDGGFVDNLDYMDDNAERLGRKKMKSDAMKRQFAINDYKKTQRVLASCQFCYGEDDSLPRAPVIAMATRCYLSCTLNQELVEGHCLIVPIQHHLTTLDGDDDLWDEVRNFMKCLMRMFAEEDKGVVFYETVINIKWQKHTYIECVPVPWEDFENLPAYFKESILASETEWSQHKKLIDFSNRPGGFRRMMVPNLPYFMVQFDHKGERGYGHVIEGTSEAAGAGEEDGAIDEGEKGGGEFPSYFAGEIIGNVLDIEPRRWRRPKRVDRGFNKERVEKFQKKYNKFDWTGMIGKL